MSLSTALFCSGAEIWQPDGDFPIGGYDGPSRQYNTQETWNIMKNAGINFSMTSDDYTEEDNNKALAFCEKAGIKLLLRTRKKAFEFSSNKRLPYKSPALFGYDAGDEPVYNEFNIYKNLYNIYRKLAPGKFIFSNLLPYEQNSGLGTINYRDYIEKYVETVKPYVISYDHYPLREAGDKPLYFENFEIVRNVGLKYNLPCWIIIQLIPHINKYASLGGVYRPLGEAELKWQIYSALAYGFKGIIYYTYWTREAGWITGEGVVKADGRPSIYYSTVKKCNMELKNIGRKMLGLKSVGIWHTGDIPSGCRRLGTDNILQLPDKLSSILGLFRDSSGNDYVMIVNKNYKKSCCLTVKTRKDVGAVYLFDTEKNEEIPVELKGRSFDINIPAGTGRLFRLKRAFTYPGMLHLPPFSKEDQAQWIWERDNLSTSDYTLLFRKKISLPAQPSQARFCITADDSCTIFINGRKAGSARNWQNGCLGKIGKLLRKGENIIAVKAKNRQHSAGLLCKVEGVLPDRQKFHIVTDHSWKVSPELGDKKWLSLNYDDNTWKNAYEIGYYPCPPWGQRLRGFYDSEDAVDSIGGTKVIADAGNGQKAYLVTGKKKIFSKEKFKIDPEKYYVASVRVKASGNKPSYAYLGIAPFTKEDKFISSGTVSSVRGTFTRLAASCKASDTVIKIADGSKWKKGKTFFVAFNAREDESDLPNFTHTPGIITNIEQKNGVYNITLSKPTGKDYPAGTGIREHYHCAMYIYEKVGEVPVKWTKWQSKPRKGSDFRNGQLGQLVLLCNWGKYQERSMLFAELKIEEVKK